MRDQKSQKPILSSKDAEQLKDFAIIGTYEGECADATITNLNGLDITEEVWENVFNSDIYKQAIELGWYIGYLGHPPGDPDCQDFRKACIVMTEGKLQPNGKIWGKFNLVNTPVGQIVKTFQDAGVTFGISVRGAGDIVHNSVDPDTFVFRGFDLVTFPAFPESIPEFTEIAASTDTDKRSKYQAVCAAVKSNMEYLDTVEAIDIVQSCFAKQSDIYTDLEHRKEEIKSSEDTAGEFPIEPLADPGCDTNDSCCAMDPRIESMTKLYLELNEKYQDLSIKYSNLQLLYDQTVKDDAKRLESIERICSSQMNDLHKTLNKIEGSLQLKTKEVHKLKHQLDKKDTILSRIQSTVEVNRQQITDLQAENKELKRDSRMLKRNTRSLQENNDELEKELTKIQSTVAETDKVNIELREDLDAADKELKEWKSKNLKYNKKIEATQAIIEDKDTIIANLQRKLDETVRQLDLETSLNRDDEIEELSARITASESRLRDYQDAYAQMYANALGVRVPRLKITANTDVNSLQNLIRTGTSIGIKSDILEPTQDIDPSYFDVTTYDDGDLVTL